VGLCYRHRVSRQRGVSERPGDARNTPARTHAGRFHRLSASRPAAHDQPGRLAAGPDSLARRPVAPDGAENFSGPRQGGAADQLRPPDVGSGPPDPKPESMRHVLGFRHQRLHRDHPAARRDAGHFGKQLQEHRRLRSGRLHRRGQSLDGARVSHPLERACRRSRRSVQSLFGLLAARPGAAKAHPGNRHHSRPEWSARQRQHQASRHGHRGRVHRHVLERRRLQHHHRRVLFFRQGVPEPCRDHHRLE